MLPAGVYGLSQGDSQGETTKASAESRKTLPPSRRTATKHPTRHGFTDVLQTSKETSSQMDVSVDLPSAVGWQEEARAEGSKGNGLKGTGRAEMLEAAGASSELIWECAGSEQELDPQSLDAGCARAGDSPPAQANLGPSDSRGVADPSATSDTYNKLVGLAQQLHACRRAMQAGQPLVPRAEAKKALNLAMQATRLSLLFADQARADAVAVREALDVEWDALCSHRLCFVRRVNELRRRGDLSANSTAGVSAQRGQATHSDCMAEALKDVCRAEQIVREVLPAKMYANFGVSVDADVLESVQGLS